MGRQLRSLIGADLEAVVNELTVCCLGFNFIKKVLNIDG